MHLGILARMPFLAPTSYPFRTTKWSPNGPRSVTMPVWAGFRERFPMHRRCGNETFPQLEKIRNSGNPDSFKFRKISQTDTPAHRKQLGRGSLGHGSEANNVILGAQSSSKAPQRGSFPSSAKSLQWAVLDILKQVHQ